MTFRLPDCVSSADGGDGRAAGGRAPCSRRGGPGFRGGCPRRGRRTGGLAVASGRRSWAHAGSSSAIRRRIGASWRRSSVRRISADPSKEELLPAFERRPGTRHALPSSASGGRGSSRRSRTSHRGAKILSAGTCMAMDKSMPLVFGAKELTLQSRSDYRRQDYQLTLAMLEAGRLDPLPMVTDRIPLEALPEAFERLRKPATSARSSSSPGLTLFGAGGFPGLRPGRGWSSAACAVRATCSTVRRRSNRARAPGPDRRSEDDGREPPCRAPDPRRRRDDRPDARGRVASRRSCSRSST